MVKNWTYVAGFFRNTPGFTNSGKDAHVQHVACPAVSHLPESLHLGFDRWPVRFDRVNARTSGRRTTANHQHARGVQRDLLSSAIRLYLGKFAPCPFFKNNLPPEGTVRRWFHYFQRTGQYEKINEELRKAGESKIYLAAMFTMTKRLTTPPEPPKWSLENDEKIKAKLEKIIKST
jgi:hypothetical protein